jgi:hypothetical protein
MHALIRSQLQQVDALRSEEASEGSWFALPEEGDDDVNWMNFQIEIVGPVCTTAARSKQSSVGFIMHWEGDRAADMPVLIPGHGPQLCPVCFHGQPRYCGALCRIVIL